MWTMENMKYQSLEFDDDVANDTSTTVCSDDMSVWVTNVAVADKDSCERGVTKAKGVGSAKASDKRNIYHDMIGSPAIKKGATSRQREQAPSNYTKQLFMILTFDGITASRRVRLQGKARSQPQRTQSSCS